MRVVIFLVLCISLSSCEYFEKKKVSSEDILEDSLKQFNWNEVDEYPFFSGCDSTATQTVKQSCFETTIRDSIGVHLGRQRFVIDQFIQDTVHISVSIDQKGEIEVDSIEISDLLQQKIPDLDSIINNAFRNLPEAYPAIKRGQPVNTLFKMPIIVKAN